MPQSRIIIGANDIGFNDMPMLSAVGLPAAGAEFGFSGDQIRKIYDEDVLVTAVPLDRLCEEVEASTGAGLQRLDGVAMMSCRPYGIGTEIDEIRRRIRSLTDHHVAFPGIPARTLPIIVSDLKHSIAGRPLPGLQPDKWTTLVPPSPSSRSDDVASALASLPDRVNTAWYDACRDWRHKLMKDLEIGGLVLSKSPDGNLRPRVALRRKPTGGEMHLAGFDPVKAYQSNLPIFMMDLDLEREPFSAFHDLCHSSFRDYALLDKSKGEIVLHRFLENNPRLLESATYTHHISETHFSIRNGRRSSMRTDLILQPVDVSRRTMVIAELKRPDVKVYNGADGDIRFTRRTLKAISQVLAYRDRLTDPRNAEEVRRRLEMPAPDRYELAVVIGLRPPDEPPATSSAVRSLALSHGVHLIRFDEIAEYGMKIIGPDSRIILP